MDAETTLKLLNSNFRTFSVEKYPEATMNSLITMAAEKILGKNFMGYKIGLKKQYRIHDIVLKQMRVRYGHLINIKILNEKKWGWATNLNRVYKTEQGRLFGTYIYDDLFFTSHSLDRWEERVNPAYYKFFAQFFRLRFHTDPTSLDLLMFNMQLPHQIGLKRSQPSYRFLNMNGGYIVIEVLDGICIAKTFISSEMGKDDDSIIWFKYDKPVMTEISDCIVPSEDLQEDYQPVDEEVPADFCASYFKKF